MKVWADIQQGKSALNSEGESLYLEYLLEDEELGSKLSEDEIRACFDYAYYTKNIDNIFKRVF
jgi:adenylosuccinate lyase